MFNPKYLNLPTVDLTSQSVNTIVDKFYHEVVDNTSSNFYMVEMQALVDEQYRSLSTVKVIHNSQKDMLKTVFTQSVQAEYSHYGEVGISDLFIRYEELSSTDPKAQSTLENDLRDITVSNLSTPIEIEAVK